jgi:uncharacterized protein (TIGR02118 family)
MIKLSVYYPSGDGSTFDHDYFRDTHIPMALEAWGLPEAEINKGLDGPHVAAAHFRFESTDALQAAFGAPGTAGVIADVAKYTNITPVMQTSEIVE